MLVFVVREEQGASVAKLPAFCNNVRVDVVNVSNEGYEVRQFGWTELATDLATSFFVLTPVTHETGLRLHIVITDVTLEPRVLDEVEVTAVDVSGAQVSMSESLRTK